MQKVSTYNNMIVLYYMRAASDSLMVKFGIYRHENFERRLNDVNYKHLNLLRKDFLKVKRNLLEVLKYYFFDNQYSVYISM